MKNTMPSSSLLTLFGVMLFWPYASTKGVSSLRQTTVSNSPSAVEEHPRVVRSMTAGCGSGLEHYCFNNGLCMLLLEVNEYHCNCERGYYGPRCAHMELVKQPIGEEQVVLVIVCVALLIIGLAGAFYFYWKWYKKRSRFSCRPKHQGYQGVQNA